MKILIIGCGSIGLRHALNARKLGAEIVLCDIDEVRMRKLSLEVNASDCYVDFHEAARTSGCVAAIIATPSNLHTKPAKAVLSAGLHVLMEKPICTSTSEANDLKDLVVKTGLTFMMGHTYRFRSEWQEVKRFLDSKPLGKIYSAEFVGGWYLPDWHIHEDYKTEYAAQKKFGGGVLFTNLSHLFDIAIWFFGDIQKISGVKMKLSDLEIDVDDSVSCILKMMNGVAINITEDFLSRLPRRSIRVNGEYGYFEVDFNRKILSVWDSRTKRIYPINKAHDSRTNLFKILEDGVLYDLSPEISDFQCSGNDAYLLELKYFMELIELHQTKFDIDIDSGIKVLDAMHNKGIESWLI